MMRRRLQLLLSACIVNFVWTTLCSPGHVANEAMTGVVIDGGNIRETTGNSNKNVVVKKRATDPNDTATETNDTISGSKKFADLADAAKSNDLKQFQWLFKEKEGGSALRDWFGPLAHVAARARSVDVLQYILELQPWTLDEKDEFGDMVVHIAAKQGHLDAIRMIANEKPTLLGRKNSDGETIAHIAARMGYIDIINFLTVEASSVFMKKDSKGRNVLHVGVEYEHFDTQTVEIINKRGVSLVSITNDGETVASIAARRGNLEMLQFLSRRKPSSVLRITDNGQTIAHIAAEHGHAKIVRYMAEKFANLVEQNKDDAGNTVAQIAAKRGYLGVIQSLTEKIPSFVENHGQNVAELALKNGHVEIIKFVARVYPPLLTKVDDSGQTILHRAVDRNLTDWETLRKGGITLPTADEQDETSSDSETGTETENADGNTEEES